ncbi:Glucokinase [Polystyrenella longa]|uniref:Glucokinase n=1 Tax=Polystyrenella longa TaxID=2528007 RepID=A0A518CHI6_9PLAN|nr:ROK family protein [Polystyrenella longa]QDU78687.1 Glucokinase [Polystyrenella longa]
MTDQNSTAASDPNQSLFLGIDIGGTNVKIGVINDAGESLANTKIPTDPELGPAVVLQKIKEAASGIIKEAGTSLPKLKAVGVVSPGTMNIKQGMLINPTNLPGWQNYPIRQKFADAFERPTYLNNDANAAAYGEYWAGAARNASSLVFWTLGTGIGCGIIINDVVLNGENSHGGECGHIIIEMNEGRPWDTGQTGTLEAYASAKALIQRTYEALDAGTESSLQQVQESGESITPLLVAGEAEKGDDLSLKLIMDTARYLGVGTTSLMHTIDPDMVLFGGAMTFGGNETELGRRFLARIKEEVKQRAFPTPYENTTINFASLGGDAGYIGSAGCARRDWINAGSPEN